MARSRPRASPGTRTGWRSTGWCARRSTWARSSTTRSWTTPSADWAATPPAEWAGRGASAHRGPAQGQALVAALDGAGARGERDAVVFGDEVEGWRVVGAERETEPLHLVVVPDDLLQPVARVDDLRLPA